MTRNRTRNASMVKGEPLPPPPPPSTQGTPADLQGWLEHCIPYSGAAPHAATHIAVPRLALQQCKARQGSQPGAGDGSGFADHQAGASPPPLEEPALAHPGTAVARSDAGVPQPNPSVHLLPPPSGPAGHAGVAGPALHRASGPPPAAHQQDHLRGAVRCAAPRPPAGHHGCVACCQQEGLCWGREALRARTVHGSIIDVAGLQRRRLCSRMLTSRCPPALAWLR